MVVAGTLVLGRRSPNWDKVSPMNFISRRQKGAIWLLGETLKIPWSRIFYALLAALREGKVAFYEWKSLHPQQCYTRLVLMVGSGFLWNFSISKSHTEVITDEEEIEKTTSAETIIPAWSKHLLLKSLRYSK